MRKSFPAFTTSLIGSMSRSRELLQAKRLLQNGKLAPKEYQTLLNQETELVVQMQERNGIDLITSGELNRDNYVSFVSEKLEGATMMSMADMLPYMEDKQGFEEILDTLDVPAVSIKNAICTGKIRRKESLVGEEMQRLRRFSEKERKATLPGPYLLTRSMWLPALSSKVYDSKEELGKDVLQVLKEEITDLMQMGVSVIQFDEPVLTEVVFTKGKTRSFMCAALSEKKDPTEELQFATALLQEIMDFIREKELISVLHVCRGNWSKNEGILLSGSYTPLVPLFSAVLPSVLALEYSTKRAGDLGSLLENERIREHCILGLGVINPRIDTVETRESIVRRAEEALQYLPKERLWLNPDCGFATFANRPVNVLPCIEKKLQELHLAQEYLRKERG